MAGPAPASLGNNTGPPQQKGSSGKEVIVGFNAKHGFFRPPPRIVALLPTTHALVPKYATAARDAKTWGMESCAGKGLMLGRVPTRKLSLSQEAVPDPTNFPLGASKSATPALRSPSRSSNCLCLGDAIGCFGRGTFAGYMLMLFPNSNLHTDPHPPGVPDNGAGGVVALELAVELNWTVR